MMIFEIVHDFGVSEAREFLKEKNKDDQSLFLYNLEEESRNAFIASLSTNALVNTWQVVKLGTIIYPEVSNLNFLREFTLLYHLWTTYKIFPDPISQQKLHEIRYEIEINKISIKNIPSKFFGYKFYIKTLVDFKEDLDNNILNFFWKGFNGITKKEIKRDIEDIDLFNLKKTNFIKGLFELIEKGTDKVIYKHKEYIRISTTKKILKELDVITKTEFSNNLELMERNNLIEINKILSVFYVKKYE